LDRFAAEARKCAATDTRDRVGLMDGLALNDLPAGLRPLILALSPGEITAPLALPNAVALFQMRDIQETSVAAATYSAIDYATYFIAGGRAPDALAQAAALRARVDVCDDLYGAALGQPAEVLERQSLPPSEIPNDIALELSKLDDGEVSTALTRSNGQTLVFLMLCGRTAELNEDATRADVASALTEARITALSNNFVEQLRADAVIVQK